MPINLQGLRSSSIVLMDPGCRGIRIVLTTRLACHDTGMADGAEACTFVAPLKAPASRLSTHVHGTHSIVL